MEDAKLELIDHRVKLWLLIVSLATIVLLATAATRENILADWHRYRSEYADVLEERATDQRGHAAVRDFEVRIVQNYVPELGAVDRCVTCHAGVEDPRMRDEVQPFTTHPGRYLQIHDPAKFGCTVCHAGQGRATETADAHGRVPHWDFPLLEGRFVVTSCSKCHADTDLFGEGGLIAQAGGDRPSKGRDLLEHGRYLASESGCRGCHMLDGKGGKIGPDLTGVGAKTRHDFDFTHFDRDAPRDVPFWLTTHFRRPAEVSPGSLMPAVARDDEAEALTAYMLSLHGDQGGAYFYRPPDAKDAPGGDGSDLYATYCAACHGSDGRSSAVPGIQTPALNNPDTLAVASDDYYRFIIAGGRGNTQMPAWGEGHGNLSREEIDRIVAHMRGWQATGPLRSDLSSEAGDAGRGYSYYTGLCAGCHGLRGQGGIGTVLNTPTFLAVVNDEFLAEAILGGRPGTAMPSWKQLSAQAVNDILAHIRSWQPEAPSFEAVQASMRGADAKENAAIGKHLYTRDCVTCHGAQGRGGIGPSLTSPDFLGAVDDRFLYRAITEGRPATAMPAWRQMPADDLGAVIAYLRSFRSEPALDLEMPVPPGDYAVGEVYYRVSCGGCHGEEGIGGSAPRLASPTFLGSVTDAVLYHWIAFGRASSPMKGFLTREQGLTQLTPAQIADVIAYLRYLGTRDDLPILRTGVGNAAVGADLYHGNCASCHGPDGEGASGPQLNIPAFLRTASDGFLAATIVLGRVGTAMQPMVHGREGLGQIQPENVADVIAYLRLWDYPQTWRRTRQVPEMTERAIASGKQKFAEFCAGCHGPTGRGAQDGAGYYAPALNNAEFLDAASDGFLLATIARGRSETPMRGFGKGSGGIGSLEGEEITDIVAFIRSWQAEHAPNSGGQEK